MLINSLWITTFAIDSLLIIRVTIFSDFSVYIFSLYNQKKFYSYVNISYDCKIVNRHLLKCKYYISRALLFQAHLKQLLDEIR